MKDMEAMVEAMVEARAVVDTVAMMEAVEVAKDS